MVRQNMTKPLIYVTRKMHFNAAHRLHNPNLSEDENIRLFGVCNNKNGHGHNYEIEVTVCGSPDDISGYLIDLKQLKEIIEKEIVSECDHKHLNYDVKWLEGINPTAENLVISFWNRLVGKINNGKLYAVKLYETERNFVEYRGE